MPEISRFYGLIVSMFYHDHNPPHFHVSYGEFKAVVYIDSKEIVGDFPKRGQKLIIEWLSQHSEELINNWELARIGEPIHQIEPLQ